jgi:hypothetical protein
MNIFLPRPTVTGGVDGIKIRSFVSIAGLLVKGLKPHGPLIFHHCFLLVPTLSMVLLFVTRTQKEGETHLFFSL